MAAYLRKSNTNLVVAKELIDNGLAVSSAHPAYYSAFLLLKYVLAHYLGMDYACQDAATNGRDSHNKLSNTALIAFAKADTTIGSDYLEWYQKLKSLRNKADYKPDAIKDDLLKTNLTTAQIFVGSVKALYKI